MRRYIALLVLSALTGAPVVGVVCAFVCSTATTSAAHHGAADEACPDSPTPSVASQHGVEADNEISSRLVAPGHDCDSHNGTRDYVLTRPDDRSGSTSSVLMVALNNTVWSTLPTILPVSVISPYHSPPSTVPSTATPLVLRV